MGRRGCRVRSHKRLKSLVAFRPGFVLPAVAAQTVATLQRFTHNRLLLNVVTGGSSTEQRAYGDFLDHDARYQRTDEFLSVVRGVWSGPGFDFEGKHYRVQKAGLTQPLEQTPTIYFGGASAAAERVAAKHADVYLTWGETPPMLAPRIASVRAQAEKLGRRLRMAEQGERLSLLDDLHAEAKQLAARPTRRASVSKRPLADHPDHGRARAESRGGTVEQTLPVYGLVLLDSASRDQPAQRMTRSGLPLGLQIVGRHFEEALVLRLASALASGTRSPHRPAPRMAMAPTKGLTRCLA